MHWFLKVGKSRGNPMQKVLEPSQRVRFIESTLRQASIQEEEGPSLGNINVKVLHQRSPHAMNFEDRSHGETERQHRCARSKAKNLPKNIHKLKEKDQVTFVFSRGGIGTPGCVNKRAGGEGVCDHEDIEKSDDGDELK